MRILVTNDDGVHAPGLAALTRALARWANGGPDRDERGEPVERQVTVVAPLANHSGASAAVGTVYERESIAYQSFTIPGCETIPTFGLDASPALSVIVAGLGGFGPPPDLVLSGINLGVNVGRSVLHSGTVGAVLTGAQLGISGLAVSMRSGAEVDHWDTAATLAVALIPLLAAAPARSILNLNAPSVRLEELKGLRRGRVGTAGIIKEAHRTDTAAVRGEVHLRLGTAIPSMGGGYDKGEGSEAGEGPDKGGTPEDDVALLGAGYASLTPLLGVHEKAGPDADWLVETGLGQISDLLGR